MHLRNDLYREEFHRFVEDMDGELAEQAKPVLHAVIDELEDVWVEPAFTRMRGLRAHLTDQTTC
jgi:hypothetical protein